MTAKDKKKVTASHLLAALRRRLGVANGGGVLLKEVGVNVPVEEGEVMTTRDDQREALASEVEGLMDSLDEHVTHDDIYESLKALRS